MSDQRTRNRIKSLKVEEVSLVDRPANSAARFVLAKRDNPEEIEDMAKSASTDVEITDEELDELEAELAELESEIEDEDEADFDDDEDSYDEDEDVEDDVVSNYETEEDDEDDEVDSVDKAHTLFNGARARTAIWPMMNALQESITSIVNDEDADTDGKTEALSKTISQFEAEAKRLLGEAESVTKNDGEDHTTMGISTQLEKRLTELHDRNVELEKSLTKLQDEREIEKREAEARSVLGKAASTDDVSRLAALLKSTSPEDAEFIKKMARKTVELAKSARVYEEIGSSKGESVGSATAVEEMAKELQKNDPKLSRAKAITKAYETLGDAAYLGDDED